MEFALVVALFVFLLYNIIAVGLAIGVKQDVNHAAFTGARAAVGSSTPVATAEAAVDDVMSEFAGGYTKTVTTETCGTATCIRVSVDYDYATNPVVPPAPGISVVLPDHLESTALVQI